MHSEQTSSKDIGSNDHSDRDVGYGKPPTHSRFQPGRSGNPSGRPKGSRNLATILDRELQAPLVIQEGGKRRTITKLDAVLKQAVNKAISGDTRSTQLVLGMKQSFEATPAAAQPLSSEADRQTQRDLVRRIQQFKTSSGGESDESA